jgi:NTP pyrophosphatase (non-canonical NTP hydrolase)
VDLSEFQRRIEAIYGERDRRRGLFETFAWLVEEMGELSRGLRRRDRENLEVEFADVAAWLVSVGNLAGIDVGACVERIYGAGCPRCSSTPCRCPMR